MGIVVLPGDVCTLSNNCEGFAEKGHPNWEAIIGLAWHPIQPQMRTMLAVLKTQRMADPKVLRCVVLIESLSTVVNILMDLFMMN